MKIYAIIGLTLILLATPAFAATNNYIAVNGNPSEIQEVNSGTVIITSQYATNGEAFAATCVGNSTTPVNVSYAWYEASAKAYWEGNTGFFNGSATNPAATTPISWDTDIGDIIYGGIEERVTCKNAGSTINTIYRLRIIPLSNRLLNYTPPVPIADFTGSPLVTKTNSLIFFTDNSTNTDGAIWNWTITPEDGTYLSSISTKDASVYIANAGNYTVSHGIETPSGSDIETKTDYIMVYNDTSTSSTGCLAISGPTGQRISGAQVDLYDIENSSWSNTTTSMGLGLITTLKGHTINCYASATGFEDGDLLAQPENNQQYYTLPLWPSGGYRNVSEGWVTLYVTVTDLDTGQPIAGATVSGGDNNYGTILNSSAFSLTTNSQGLANVPVLNNTVVYLTAYKAGYTTLTAAVNTGTGSGGDAKVTHWFKLSKGAITVVPSMTTLPGGGYPTTQRTIDPAGTPDPAGGSSAYSSAKGQQMMDYLAMNGMDLVQLCFLVTVLGLLGIKLGK